MADVQFARGFALETWTLYSVGILLTILRYVGRIRRLGLSGLKADDYVMVNAVFWYTMLCVSFNKIAGGEGSNLILADEDIDAITPENKAARITGSKWVFVSEHAMLLCIWSLKICMLVLYAGITDGRKERKWVTWLSYWIGASFVGAELALFLCCIPIQNYWAFPTPNPQCYNYQHFEIIQLAMNLPGEISVLLIGIPLFVSIRLPKKQKAILLVVFGMGGFTIVASILTKIYCLVPSLISYVYMNWYFREASVALYCTNLPTIWPLMREIFPRLATWSSQNRKQGNGSRYISGTHPRQRINSTSYGMKPFDDNKTAQSQERINEEDDTESAQSVHGSNAMKIQRDVVVTVESHGIDEAAEKQHVQKDW